MHFKKYPHNLTPSSNLRGQIPIIFFRRCSCMLSAFIASAFLLSCGGGVSDGLNCASRVSVQNISLGEARAGVKLEAPSDISKNGRILLYRNFLLVNDPGIGFHIFDNTDARSPKALYFMRIPGNYDLTIKDDVLYADSYIDLLRIGLSTEGKPQVLNRAEAVFEGDINVVIQEQYPVLIKHEILLWRDKSAVEEACR